ncbi:MAG: hypothetical protein SGPRY_009236 [Prymnesium sp.]
MEISVPLELQLVLREFTKSVLREKPADILLFSRDYFLEKCTRSRMGAQRHFSSTFNELPQTLKKQIEAVFKR